EWVHVQLHQQKGMISLSPPTICNSAVKVINDIERSEKTSTEQSIIHKINRATLINCFRRSE
ncbi:hypothetical protein RZQ94_23605, partial [Escherichia coli]